MATLAIGRQDFSHSTCLTLLQKTSFPARKQVRGVNQQAIPSQRLTLGLYAHGNQVGLTLNTDRFEPLCRYVNLFLQASHPRVTWTSLHINNNMPVHLHRDRHNLRQSVNLTISLGAFTGGELWIEVAPEEVTNNPSVHWLTQDDGTRIPGIVVDSHNRPIILSEAQPLRVAMEGSQVLRHSLHVAWLGTYPGPLCESLAKSQLSMCTFPPSG